MKLSNLKRFCPAPFNILLAVISSVMMIGAFPDLELWFLAWFAFIPLFFAIDSEKQSAVKSFLLGWIWGIFFFFGSCWWLTYAPIKYAGFPAWLAYSLMLVVAATVGLFTGSFGAIFSILLKRFGGYAIFSAPFIWTAVEFLRFWVTGNNWNAVAYSQAFAQPVILQPVRIGGIYLLGTLILLWNSLLYFQFAKYKRNNAALVIILAFGLMPLFLAWIVNSTNIQTNAAENIESKPVAARIVAIQPNVPMSGFSLEKYWQLRQRHVELAEAGLRKLRTQDIADNEKPTTVIFPESPMYFMFEKDPEFQDFIHDFAVKNNVSVLFNAVEPDHHSDGLFNSAVFVDTRGEKIGQYDKIHLVPFGETVPFPLNELFSSFVSSFASGSEYDLFQFGEAKAGIMICFESHFPTLSREFVRDGADVLIEMTNDGYMGNTSVLRQHLANAVFRAVETNRPVLRVTNVGVSGYINQRGEVLNPAENYAEATRIWTISKSDGSQTFYMRYGDWAAWLGVLVTLALLFLSFRKRNNEA